MTLKQLIQNRNIFKNHNFQSENTGTTAYDCSGIGIIGLTIELSRFGGRENQTEC